MERLQKLIARAGITSRRKAEELIVQGRVKVNGEVITQLGYQAKPADRIEVDGRLLRQEEKVYYLLNKPKHTICSLADEKGRDTVLTCLPDVTERIFPVGRLDYDTTGVLILTNDGEFANLMMHPSHHLVKTYEAAIDGILSQEQLAMLRRGIRLDDGMTLPAQVAVLQQNFSKKKSVLQLSIQEGRNREIRRMIEYFGCHVTRLERKSIGFLNAGSLRQGEYRRLRMYEVKRLIEQAEQGSQPASMPKRASSCGSGSM